MNEQRNDTVNEAVTIKQLARLLGLAHSTVSRALNGHTGISETTKKRVKEAAAQYGYVPNSAARILRNARSGILAGRSGGKVGNGFAHGRVEAGDETDIPVQNGSPARHDGE